VRPDAVGRRLRERRLRARGAERLPPVLGLRRINDTRSCSGCTCDGTSNLSCALDGAYFYANSSCTSTNCKMTTACQKCDVGTSGDVNSVAGDWSTNGKESDCTVHTGSSATGTVTPTGPHTVCCQ
jgi:hypothetical protein